MPGKYPEKNVKYIPLLFALILLLFSEPIRAAESPKLNPDDRQPFKPDKVTIEDIPYVQGTVHNIGDVWLTVTNIGQFGTGYLGSAFDPISGMVLPSCVYPANSALNYLYVGSFWIGAVSGRDTLVSVGIDDYYSILEFWPGPDDPIEVRSISASSPYFSEDARSEQDLIAIYNDQLTNPQYVNPDQITGRPHIPLNVEVTQRSYAWSYSYARDFILFDYSIKNIGQKKLNEVYMGIYVDGDVHHEINFGPQGYGEDLVGFLRSHPARHGGCEYLDTINIAYIMDNDGDPNTDGFFTNTSILGAAGVRVVRTPSDSLKYSFNWWFTNYGDPADDFGPRMIGNEDDPFRDMNGVLGTPLGDNNKYYVMRHEEFDYDQLFCGKDHTSEGWLPRDERASSFADGDDARYLLSFGPFDISPGEVLPVSFAWILGDNIHRNPNDFEEYFSVNQPEIYYSKLDFSELAANSRWASWIYDNPGYDTDNDGYRGKFRICAYDSTLSDSVIQEDPLITDTFWVYNQADTFFYEGDGVPDFRGASPPPAPELWIIDNNGDTLRSKIYASIDEYYQGQLRIRWNGFLSETEKDVFSNKPDFEGYRVYLALAPNPAAFSVVASYDIEDYSRWVWNENYSMWELKDTPFSLDSLKNLYGTGFNPDLYDIDHPFIWNDTVYYFIAQDWNQAGLRDTLSIHKVYPDEPPPTILNLDSAQLYHPEELTPDGLFFKYYEYEYILRNLLPGQLNYIAVTAFDYGSPASGLPSLETPPLNNMVAEYPQNPSSESITEGLNVIVYPNPYRLDGGYRENGFEGRDYYNNRGQLIEQDGLLPERTRAIHFANLPAKCTIRIFSIDGDLVRVIEHDVPPDFPQSSHERWDMITRNTQAVASGIYYFHVESDIGSQIGTIVIIK
jgi:hypothetical protein